MRLYILCFLILSLGVSLVHCSKEDAVPTVDQTLHIYLTNTDGKNALTPTDTTRYAYTQSIDLLADKDNIPVNGMTLSSDIEQNYFLQYIDGAKRNVKTETSAGKTILSEIEIQRRKKNTLLRDTLILEYLQNSEGFFLKNAQWNGVPKQLTKKSGIHELRVMVSP